MKMHLFACKGDIHRVHQCKWTLTINMKRGRICIGDSCAISRFVHIDAFWNCWWMLHGVFSRCLSCILTVAVSSHSVSSSSFLAVYITTIQFVFYNFLSVRTISGQTATRMTTKCVECCWRWWISCCSRGEVRSLLVMFMVCLVVPLSNVSCLYRCSIHVLYYYCSFFLPLPPYNQHITLKVIFFYFSNLCLFILCLLHHSTSLSLPSWCSQWENLSCFAR